MPVVFYLHVLMLTAAALLLLLMLLLLSTRTTQLLRPAFAPHLQRSSHGGSQPWSRPQGVQETAVLQKNWFAAATEEDNSCGSSSSSTTNICPQ
jgi:hypothetical protein